MDVRWLIACIDRPASQVDSAIAFWSRATGTEPSPAWGPAGELVTLVPPSGDPHLAVQRLATGRGGVHLDVHVDDVGAARGRLVASGGAIVAELPSHTVATTPSGFVLCLVADDHHPTRTAPVGLPDGGEVLLDQVCVDIPHGSFEQEKSFWAAFTGYEVESYGVVPYARVSVPDHLPLRILLQERDDSDGEARGHLDFACTDRMAAARWLSAQGATMVREDRVWVVLRDPQGHELCATWRLPATGRGPE